MRSRLDDIRCVLAITKPSMLNISPAHANHKVIAKYLYAIGLLPGATPQEVMERAMLLQDEYAYIGHLAYLSATEGDVRQLANALADNRRYVKNERLRNVLRSYTDGGLPDRFRSMIEELFAAVKNTRKKGNAAGVSLWQALIDYRNWLAHGRIGEPPRRQIPNQEQLETEAAKALNVLKKALEGAI